MGGVAWAATHGLLMAGRLGQGPRRCNRGGRKPSSISEAQLADEPMSARMDFSSSARLEKPRGRH